MRKEQVARDLHRYLFEKFQVVIGDSISTARIAGIDCENFSMVLLISLLKSASDVSHSLDIDEEDFIEMAENYFEERRRYKR